MLEDGVLKQSSLLIVEPKIEIDMRSRFKQT